MTKQKKAFTLIEIIFVIIILGTLALVAIPKLQTNRDDSKIAVALAELGMLVSELGAYYTSKDTFSSSLSDMTNIKDINYTLGWNFLTQRGEITYYTPNNNGIKEACVKLKIQNKDGNLTFESVVDSHGNICKGVQSTQAYIKLIGTKYFGGRSVSY